MGMRMRVWCVILVAALGGCDRDLGAPPQAPQKKAPELAVDIQGVTPLLPDRRTHVAATGTGQVFWVQEATEPGGRETVFSLPDGGLPGATRLTSLAILEALGERSERGGIQSLAAAPGGELYFYFAGESRRKLMLAVGAFSPASGETRILANLSALRQASGMGNTLALARGSLLREAGGRTSLWLRHDHGFVLLSVDPADGASPVRRLFDRVRPPNGEDLQLVASGEDLTAVGDGWVYLDRPRGRLWRIGPTGEASVLADVSDLPRAVTAPAADERGRLAMFAPDGPPFTEPPDNPLAPTPQVAALPAWVTFDGQRRTVLGRETFTAPARLNVRALAFPRVFRDRSSWLGYDSQTGELLRVRVVER
jgi:hypothetical protein